MCQISSSLLCLFQAVLLAPTLRPRQESGKRETQDVGVGTEKDVRDDTFSPLQGRVCVRVGLGHSHTPVFDLPPLREGSI